MDGCAGQYKNKNNFINLCHHKEDFAVDAEWNFFATSHGKSACDSIGGTVKQLVTKASLQRPYTELILTADAIVNFYEVNIPGIKFFNVKSEEVSESPVTLQGRFLKARTVKGTQQYHRFVSVKKSSLHVYKLSSQEEARLGTHLIISRSRSGREQRIHGDKGTELCVLAG